MTTRVEALHEPRTMPVTLRAVASDFGRLLGLALVTSLAVGLLLTAAAVAFPAPLEDNPAGHDGSAVAASGVETEVSVDSISVLLGAVLATAVWPVRHDGESARS